MESPTKEYLLLCSDVEKSGAGVGGFQGGGDRSCDKGVHSEAVTNDRVKCGSRSCDQGVVGGENTTNDRVRSWMCAVQRWIM